MARPKGRPKGKGAAGGGAAREPGGGETPTPRFTIINLKGSREQADWLEAAHRETHIPKSVIVRLALTLWGETNGRPTFPPSEDDR